MLQELRSAGAPGALIITDSAFLSGRKLLVSLIISSVQRGEHVHIFSFEFPVEEFLVGVPDDVFSSLTFHDGFSDPLGWRRVSGSLTPRDFTPKTIRERLSRSSSSPVTMVLDSLSWVLARCPLPSVCHTLREVTRPQRKEGSHDVHFLSLLHVDLHDPGVVRSVRTVCDTVINVTDGGERLGVTVTQRRRSGKVVTSTENIRIREDFSLETTTENQPDPQRTQVDPTMNLTFNLRLSETERVRRESATLPYTFSESKKSSLLQSSGSSAKIFYDPDPGDDLDDEDPDDDLDV